MDSDVYICTNNTQMSRPLEKFDDSKLINNPFTSDLKIPVTLAAMPGQYTFDLEAVNMSGDLGTYVPSKGFLIDKIQSSRVYYSANAKDKVYGLTDKAQRLYLYILYNMPKSKPYVQINKHNYMFRNNVKSRITYTNAVKELITEGFICNTQYRTVYWVNPLLFSSGNRLKIYPNNIDIKGEL